MNKRTLNRTVERFRRGDANAFDVIYDATRVDVYYVILNILRDASLAEDVMQDTYMKMIEKLPEYEARGEFKAWLMTLAKNLALNTYNRRKREIAVDYDESAPLFDVIYPDGEKRYHVQALLEKLEPVEREIVIRHALFDEKHRVIAETLGMPLGTVLWKYREAIKKLRKEGGFLDEK